MYRGYLPAKFHNFILNVFCRQKIKGSFSSMYDKKLNHFSFVDKSKQLSVKLRNLTDK